MSYRGTVRRRSADVAVGLSKVTVLLGLQCNPMRRNTDTATILSGSRQRVLRTASLVIWRARRRRVAVKQLVARLDMAMAGYVNQRTDIRRHWCGRRIRICCMARQCVCLTAPLTHDDSVFHIVGHMEPHKTVLGHAQSGRRLPQLTITKGPL